MGDRLEALKRVFAFLWVWFVGSILITIMTIIGAVWMLIDVVWQLIAGSDGLSASGTVASWIRGTITWGSEQTNYALTGTGELQIVPMPA